MSGGRTLTIGRQAWRRGQCQSHQGTTTSGPREWICSAQSCGMRFWPHGRWRSTPGFTRRKARLDGLLGPPPRTSAPTLCSGARPLPSLPGKKSPRASRLPYSVPELPAPQHHPLSSGQPPARSRLPAATEGGKETIAIFFAPALPPSGSRGADGTDLPARCSCLRLHLQRGDIRGARGGAGVTGRGGDGGSIQWPATQLRPGN